MATIEYRDLYKAFDRPVLAGVSLAVAQGELVSIIGPSGAGKSVLLKMTNGLLPPDRGDVLIDGQSVVTASKRALRAIRQRIGYVFQYAALFDSMTVYENVVQGLPEGSTERLGSSEVLRCVCRALEEVSLDPVAVLTKSPAELSGGMRKRVGIARAIIGNPEIILYDEPMTGLDPVTSATVEHLISAIRTKFGRTSIVVTHDVVGAVELSDRIVLLAEGKFRFVGTPTAFLQSQEPLVQAFANRDVAAHRAALGGLP
jgi:phospholipid/cholesterol/gamma-HCH transport system ATP-binding protein